MRTGIGASKGNGVPSAVSGPWLRRKVFGGDYKRTSGSGTRIGCHFAGRVCYSRARQESMAVFYGGAGL